jgi:hypothetical protein
MLKMIAGSIKQLAEAHISSATIDTEARFNPHPYDHVLSPLALSVGSGPLRAFKRGASLCIEGSREAMGALSSFFEIAHAKPHDRHAHHEYGNVKPHVADDSLPLIVMASRPRNADSARLRAMQS